MANLEEIKPQYPDTSLDEKELGKNIAHASQPVTIPPASSTSWTATTGAGSSHLDGSNSSALAALTLTVNEIYSALLKEGLIKKK